MTQILFSGYALGITGFGVTVSGITVSGITVSGITVSGVTRLAVSDEQLPPPSRFRKLERWA